MSTIRRNLLAAAWVAAILVATFGVPAFLLADPVRRGSPPWAFGLALGYAALAFAGVQFVLTARFRTLGAPIGIDLVYYLHRYLAVGGLLLATLHAAVIAWRQPWLAGIGAWPDPHVAAGWLAWFLYAVLVASSLGRKRLRLHYDAWRRLHVAVAIVAFLATAWHAWASGRYLDTSAKDAVFLAAVGGWLATVVWVRGLRPAWILRRPWQVASVTPEVERVWTVVLTPVGHPGLGFEAGQFAWISVRLSPWHLREHPFSIASSSTSPARLEFAVKERGDFTRAVGRLEPGERVYVDAPYGAFSVERYPRTPRFVFVAGGIGIAPILSCLRWLADRRDPRELVLIYANVSLASRAYADELDALERRLRLKVVHVLDSPPPGWTGERGFLTREILERHLPRDRRGVEYFVCGPGPMTAIVERELGALGVAARHVRTELFDLV